MNLFVVVWHGKEELHRNARSALNRTLAAFTQLNPLTIVSDGTKEPVFIAMAETPSTAASPRTYCHNCRTGITFYSGLPVDSTGRIVAHDARCLHDRWRDCADRLEGQYCVIRFLRSSVELQIHTDPLGLEQIYYVQSGGTWAFSNNATVAAEIFGLSTLDSLGVSLALSLGWVSSDRTLTQGVRVLRGGQSWRFLRSNRPKVQTHFSLRAIAQSDTCSGSPDPQELSKAASILIPLSREFGELLCPLTGGRDSRVNAAFLQKAGVPVHFFTSGTKRTRDAIIAKRVAEVLQRPHELVTVQTREITANWDRLAKQLIDHTDGMVSLWQIADVFYHRPHIQKLRVSITGIGGEILRGHYSNHDIHTLTCTKERTVAYLCDKLLYQGSIVNPDAITMTKQFIRDFVEECFDSKVPGVNIPDLFYTDERVRRWGGSNFRKNGVLGDRYSFFCTRPFVMAAFKTAAQSRSNEGIHRQLLSTLAPALLDIPFDDGDRWGSMKGSRRVIANPHYRPQVFWLSRLRPKFTSTVLDIPKTSPVWNFLSRPDIERFINLPLTQLRQQSAVMPFFSALTIIYFERRHH